MIMFILRILLVIILFGIVIFLLKFNGANKKSKRIANYVIEPIHDNSISFSEKFVKWYFSFVKKMRPFIKKSKILMDSSKKYEKHIKYKDRNIILGVDYIITKLVIAFVFIILTTFSQVYSGRVLNIFDFIVNFVLGYYLLDIYLYFSYKKKKKLMGEELLRAVIIMNNAFKAGKSTLQALKIASDELEEPLKDEFKKMYLDIKYGLSVDTVFERFAKRVNIDEAVYLSSSLTVLNKTGGNIIEVFSSIERTLFDKKKLDEELKNISSAPKMVVRILFVIPIVFTLIIYILNPNYFDPLFNSILGYMIIGIIILMFILYAFLLRRILRIEV